MAYFAQTKFWIGYAFSSFQSTYFYSVICLDTDFLKGYEITYPIPNFVLTNYTVSYQIMIRNMLYLVNDCHRYNFHRNIFIPHFVYQINVIFENFQYYSREGLIHQDYMSLGAGIWCIDPWYCFGGRSTSAGKFGQENFFTSILMVQNAIFFAF